MVIKKYFLFVLLVYGIISCPVKSFAQAHTLPPFQPEQEACNALELCGGYFYTPYSYSGYGYVKEEFQGEQIFGAGCHNESNSVWFRLDVVSPGKLAFIIRPDNPGDDYDFTVWDGTNINCLYVSSFSYQRLRCNGNTGFGTDGTLGLSDTATPVRIEGGQNAQGMLKSLDVTAGSFYYILVDNFSGSTGGFSIDFTNSTAVFRGNGNPPAYAATTEDSCKNSIRLNVSMNTQVQCASIAADGSDFELEPAIATVVAASGENCFSSAGYTTKINLLFSSPLPPGTYAIKAKRGSDNNSLLNLCGTEQLPGDSIAFTVDVSSLEPAPKFTATTKDDACNNTRKLNLFVSKQVLCSSIAGDGSDFSLAPSIATVVAATGMDCTGNTGYGTKINITFSNNLPAGTYTLHVQRGSDGNIVLDRCGNEQAADDSINFTIDASGIEPAPKYSATTLPGNCDHNLKLTINMSKQLRCNSIAADGSDFELLPPVANVMNAVGVNCTGNTAASSQVDIRFSTRLPPGRYTLKAKKGSDLNTLVDLCGEEQLQGDSIVFIIDPTLPKFKSTARDSCRTSRKLSVRLSKVISCNSIAADGTDFEIEPAIATVTAANAIGCTGNPGYTDRIYLAFNKSLPVGIYTLHAKMGSDNNVLLDTCGQEQSITDKIEFEVASPGFEINAGNDTATCAGVPVQLRAVLKGGSTPVSWAPAASLNNAAILNPVASTTLSTNYSVSALLNGLPEACRQTDTVNVRVLTGFTIAPADTSICAGNRIELRAIGDTAYQYKWSPGTYLSDSLSNHVLVKPDTTIQYLVTASYPGCADELQTVVVKTEPVPVILPLQAAGICEGNSMTLSATVMPSWYNNYQYHWSPVLSFNDPFTKTPVYKAVGNTTISLIVSTAVGCADTVTRAIPAILPPVLEVVPAVTTFYNEPVVLPAVTNDPLAVINWSPPGYLSDEHIIRPVARPPADQLYIVTATNGYGCSSSDTVLVKVLKELFIPNAFTPNSDGLNKVWNIPGLKNYEQAVVKIFNRFGQTVYESRGYTKPWDGTFNGQPQPIGAYFYIIDLHIPGRRPIVGSVTLIR